MDDAAFNALEAELQALDDKTQAFTDAQKAVSGVVAILADDGAIVFERGLQRPEDVALTQTPDAATDADAGNAATNDTTGEEGGGPTPAGPRVALTVGGEAVDPTTSDKPKGARAPCSAALRGDLRVALKGALPESYYPVADDLDGGARPIAELTAIADAMIDGLGVTYVEGGDRACYIRDLDELHMPAISRFHDAKRLFATKFHEAAHATEVPKRLNIDYGRRCFGNGEYSRGELYAEMTAAILGATLGFKPDHLEEHAGYIQSWLRALRNDKRFVLKAAADAQRGADYLLAAAGLLGVPNSHDTAGAEDQGDEL